MSCYTFAEIDTRYAARNQLFTERPLTMSTLFYPSWLTGLPNWKRAEFSKRLHRIHDARFHLTLEAVRDLKGTAGNVVLWCPQSEAGEGYVTEWSEAVAQVQKMVGPTTIKIVTPSSPNDVVIPDGTWQLNDTTLVGVAWDASTDSSYRGWQELIYVYGANNRTWLKGCVGLKDMYFRSSDYANSLYGDSGTVSTKVGNTMTFVAGGGSTFSADDVGKPIRIGSVGPYWNPGSDTDYSENRGTFIITAVLGPTTIQFENASGITGDANNGNIGWSLCTSMFICLNDNVDKKPFILDNVDFHYGGDYEWGAFYVAEYENQFFVLKNGASVRWYAIVTDGYIVLQSDGSPAWVGTDAFAGMGYADVFPMAGTQVRTSQGSIDGWSLHQPTTVYLPNNTGNWTPWTPETIHEALDQLAERVKALEP